MTTAFKKYIDVQYKKESTILTGIKCFDKWFSNDGGMVIGSAIFLTGTSGAGKTTLSVFLMKLLENIKVALYAREMTAGSVKQQTKNMNITSKNSLIADHSSCPTHKQFMQALDIEKPKVVIYDSLQVVATEDYPDKPELTAQLDIIRDLRNWTDLNNAVLFVIGHNNKDGEFKGDNSIMQMFDAHIEMIHHKKEDFRTIAWGQKNRKGPLGMLYYTFSKSGIDFFTQEEWDARTGNHSLDGIACSVIKRFLSGLNAAHPNYSSFYDEFQENLKDIADNFQGIRFTTEVICMADEVSKKHGLIKA